MEVLKRNNKYLQDLKCRKHPFLKKIVRFKLRDQVERGEFDEALISLIEGAEESEVRCESVELLGQLESIDPKVLKHENKDVIVWSWRESLSVQLRESVGVNNVFYIDDIIDKIKKKKKRRMIF
ncbi:MAG: hypothetical protein ACFFEO_17685 [Candidatus Thorarchaeota archaeon]